jgi:hypothetical protein
MQKSNNDAAATPQVQRDANTLMKALAAPFDPSEVKFKPAVVSGNRALALAYVDARVIQDRLDEVLGVDGWQDDYECLADGSVLCRLRLRLGDEWITKVDVGGPSEQPDGGDRMKAAFSDALKRAAVKFGVGRYLYRLTSQWVDYDPQRRQFVRTPVLTPTRSVQETAPAAAKPKARVTALPANGAELRKRLQDYEAKLVAQGLCSPGMLIAHVCQAGVKAGHGADLGAWTGPAIQFAVDQTKAFETSARQQRGQHRDVA